MNRISYLILFLLIGFTAQSQVLTVNTESDDACVNESIWLKASGHNLYVWSDTVRLDTVIGDSVNFSASTAGNYAITVLGYTVFPADTDTLVLNITVHSNPSVIINSSANSANNFLCLGDTATLEALGNGLASYAWSPGISTTDSTGQITGVFPTSTVSYELMVTDTNGCTATGIKQVKVQANSPSLDLSSEDSVICPGGSTEITATSNGLSFSWDNASTLNMNTGKIVEASPITSTIYNVTATLNACNTFGSITVGVLDSPAMTVTESTNGASICLDSFSVITAICAECVSYIYTFPNSSVQTTNTSKVVSPNQAGQIDIIVSGVGENSCKTIETVTINVDSCFNGTAFSVEELSASDIQMIQRSNTVEVLAPVAMNSIALYDLLGSQVIELSQLNTNSTLVDVSALSSGIYIMVVRSDNGNVTKKLYLN
jgi:hypothetical protein